MYVLILFEILIILAYGLLFSHPVDVDTSLYPYFQDVNVMVFIGFGLLMTFPKSYSFSALTYTFLLAVMSIQIYPLMKALVHMDRSPSMSIETLIAAEFAAAAGLITLGVVLGKTTLLQSCIITLIMIPVYTVNEYIGLELIKASDVGGSIAIHTFGALFGLACSKGMNLHNDKAQSSYTSDVFSMIGTLFLFIYWPSFNAALASDETQARSILNTFMSLTGSVLGAVIVSKLSRTKLDIVDVQNATLAGGVVMGSSCDMSAMNAAGAIGAGFCIGSLSSAMFSKVNQTIIGDTCGVLFLHGVPGVLGAVVSAITAAYSPDVSGWTNQLYFLSSTIAISCLTGGLTGLALRSSSIDRTSYFADNVMFHSV